MSGADENTPMNEDGTPKDTSSTTAGCCTRAGWCDKSYTATPGMFFAAITAVALMAEFVLSLMGTWSEQSFKTIDQWRNFYAIYFAVATAMAITTLVMMIEQVPYAKSAKPARELYHSLLMLECFVAFGNLISFLGFQIIIYSYTNDEVLAFSGGASSVVSQLASRGVVLLITYVAIQLVTVFYSFVGMFAAWHAMKDSIKPPVMLHEVTAVLSAEQNEQIMSNRTTSAARMNAFRGNGRI